MNIEQLIELGWDHGLIVLSSPNLEHTRYDYIDMPWIYTVEHKQKSRWLRSDDNTYKFTIHKMGLDDIKVVEGDKARELFERVQQKVEQQDNQRRDIAKRELESRLQST